MYSIFYRIIQRILLKRSLYDDFLKVLKTENIKQIVEIGCADSIILKKLNKDINYDGFDVDDDFIEKSKKKYLKNKNYNFENKSIHKINFDKYDKEKTIILLIGVFHHVDDDYIKIFTEKTKFFKVYGVDAVRLNDQKFFTKILLDLDKGKFIRSEKRYKDLLEGYKFILARNRYLNFDYDHLISVKNIKTDRIKEILKI